MSKTILPLVLMFGLGASCFPTNEDLYNVKPRFKTTESSVLFFRNTRSVFYDLQERPDAFVELFYPSTPTASDSEPGYIWYIAYNRSLSKAMAFHEPTPSLVQDPCAQIQWHWTQPDGSVKVVSSFGCPALHPEENFEFLVKSYRQLNADRVAYIKTQSGKLRPLFPLEENKRRFLRLVRDYLELVDLV